MVGRVPIFEWFECLRGWIIRTFVSPPPVLFFGLLGLWVGAWVHDLGEVADFLKMEGEPEPHQALRDLDLLTFEPVGSRVAIFPTIMKGTGGVFKTTILFKMPLIHVMIAGKQVTGWGFGFSLFH